MKYNLRNSYETNGNSSRMCGGACVNCGKCGNNTSYDIRGNSYSLGSELNYFTR